MHDYAADKVPVDNLHDSNLAGEAEVTVSSEVAGFDGKKVTDRIWGIGNGYNRKGQGCGEWASCETNPWVRLAWKDAKKINRVVIYDRVGDYLVTNWVNLPADNIVTVKIKSGGSPADSITFGNIRYGDPDITENDVISDFVPLNTDNLQMNVSEADINENATRRVTRSVTRSVTGVLEKTIELPVGKALKSVRICSGTGRVEFYSKGNPTMVYDLAASDEINKAHAGRLTFHCTDNTIRTLDVPDIQVDRSATEVSVDPVLENVDWIKLEVTGGEGFNVGLAEIKVYGIPVTPEEYDIPDEEVDTLFSRLDRENPDLAGVFAIYDGSGSPNCRTDAVQALLEYYRKRTQVWHREDNTWKPLLHSVDRNKKQESFNNPGFINPNSFCASQSQAVSSNILPIARNQLRKVLTASFTYLETDPRYLVYMGEDIDWFYNPFREMWWELMPNYHWQFACLLQAYWYTGDEEYVREWIEELLDWMNDRAGRVPRNANGSYYYNQWEVVHQWNTLQVASRIDEWVNDFQYAIDSPLFTKGLLVKFLNSLFDHVDFIRHYNGDDASYLNYSIGNFGLAEARSVNMAAVMFPEFKNSGSPDGTGYSWRASATRYFNDQVNIDLKPFPFPEGQFYPDGMHVEEAMIYHIWVADMCEQVSAFNKRNGYIGYDRTYSDRVRAMIEVLMKMALPNGDLTHFGDDGEGRDNVRICYKYVGEDEVYDLPEFRYVFSGYRDGIPPAETAFALKNSGYYSMRSGWNENAICMVLKCGPYSWDSGGPYGMHSGPDNGTFELYAGGRLLTPDSGTYNYDKGPGSRRWWYRQTKVHQTMTLDNATALAKFDGVYTDGEAINGPHRGMDFEGGKTIQWNAEGGMEWKARSKYAGINGISAYVDSSEKTVSRTILLPACNILKSVRISLGGAGLSGSVTLSSSVSGNEPVIQVLKSNEPLTCRTGWEKEIPDGSVTITIDCDSGVNKFAFDDFEYTNNTTEYAPALKLWKTAPKLDTLVVENQSYPSLKHRRAVHFVKNIPGREYFVIIDEASGTAAGNVDVHFQFAPAETLPYEDNAVYDYAAKTAHTKFHQGWNLLVKGLDSDGATIMEEEGWYSPYANAEMRRPAFAFRKNKNSAEGVRFVTLVVPYEGTVPPTAGICILNNPPVDSNIVELSVNVGNGPLVLGYDIDAKESEINTEGP